MDKNAIKKFAVWARRELIERVSQRALIYGISEDAQADAEAVLVNGRALSRAEQRQRRALIGQIREKGYAQVMEEAAYTWFNRFAALRFMEVNGYLPSHVRVFTDESGAFRPQILTEAIHLELDGLDMEKVYALERANQKEELFKYLLIVQCNALNPILPGMFQRIEDYTELLLPDYLLREGSVIEQMVTTIPEADWTDQVQIIGWLYQYYNTEPKDQVFADLKKNIKISKEKIPAATQLFTPDWIVHYMVENSLGRLWIEGHPNSAASLLPSKEEQAAYVAGERNPGNAKWHYYLEEAEQAPEVEAQLKEIRKEYAALRPEEILCIDPCMGSGHILCVLFDALVKIYEDYGYTAREAAVSIVRNNLWGLDIDDRAAQLAYFAVMMKARQYDRRFFSRKIQPHVYAVAESNPWAADRDQGTGDRGQESAAVEYFCNGDEKRAEAMRTIIAELYDAKEYGSILTVTPQDWPALYARFDEIREEVSIYRDAALALEPLVQTAQALGQKYSVVVTNPPYMNLTNGNIKLQEYVKEKYHDAKSDMYSIFIDRCHDMSKENFYFSMITQQSWLSLPSFFEMRKRLFRNVLVVNLAQLGSHGFDEINGEVVSAVTFSFRKTFHKKYVGCYSDLQEGMSEAEKEQSYLTNRKLYFAKQDLFEKVPNNVVVYDASENALSKFADNIPLKNIVIAKPGMQTSDNDRFLRLWHEIVFERIGFGYSHKKALESDVKWFPYNKGIGYRKWYGNNDYIVNFYHDGEELKYWLTHNPKDPKTTHWSRNMRNYEFYFVEGITFTAIGKLFSARLNGAGYLFDTKGPMMFGSDLTIVCGFVNSVVFDFYNRVLCKQLTKSSDSVNLVPFVFPNMDAYSAIENVVEKCRTNSKNDWDSFETSWDFKMNPMTAWRISGASAWGDNSPQMRVESSYKAWKTSCDVRFQTLKSNEEELNRIFIDIYGLQEELTPDVAEKDVTVRRFFDSKDDIPESMRGSVYALTKQDAIKNLISYAVGCMFGRYSLDEEGLAYAGGTWDASKYKTFPADKDAIIPICDDEYFTDDIVGLFVKFIETVYGADTLEENLRFIANALGTKGGTTREVIRNYFLNDFYKDHLRTYQKRPIYWLFDSGKKNGFKCLIYMHRYQPDTIARIRTDYVHEQQSRYRTAIADLEQRVNNASSSERVKLNKQLQKLQGQSEEVRIYEEKIHHLADQFIAIDLDDGVKVNYAKFQDVLAKIK